MVGAYVFGVFATIVLPVPRLGITPEVVAGQGFTSSGAWIEEPQRVIAFGVLYFTILGLFESLVRARPGMSSSEPAAPEQV